MALAGHHHYHDYFIHLFGVRPFAPGRSGGRTSSGNWGSIYGKKITAEAYRNAQIEFLLSYWSRSNGEWPDKNPNFTEAALDREIYVRLMLLQRRLTSAFMSATTRWWPRPMRCFVRSAATTRPCPWRQRRQQLLDMAEMGDAAAIPPQRARRGPPAMQPVGGGDRQQADVATAFADQASGLDRLRRHRAGIGDHRFGVGPACAANRRRR